VAAVSEPAASATPAANEPSELGDAVTPPLVFALLFVTSTVGMVREIAIVSAGAYLVPDHPGDRWLPLVLSLLAACIGGAVARRRNFDARQLPWLAFALAIAIGAFGPAVFYTFGHGGPVRILVYAFSLVAGGLTGAASVSLARFLGKTLLALGAFAHLANPFRLLGFALACGVAAGVSAIVGVLRTGSALALLYATLGFWCASLYAFLEARSFPRARAIRWTGALLFAAGLPTFVLHERLLPSDELGLHTNPVVYRAVGNAQRFTITSGQDAFELWIDGHLAVSTIDEARYSEALVQPALAVAPRRSRVLILGNGLGLLEREVLRHPDVESITLVVLDRRSVELGQKLAWLRARSRDSLLSPKLRVIEAEAAVWLEESTDVFDVALVDLPDPHGYVEGKTYTRWFFATLAAHLAPDGLCAIQATSAFATPRTFQNVEHTVASAGFATLAYHAPIPTMGDWGFVLGFQGKPPPLAAFDAAAPFLSGASPRALFSLPRDTRSGDSSLVSTLAEQHAVELFAEERGN
jgi:spermidine synthase